MNMELAILTQNLKEAFNGKPWYGNSMMNTLNKISWKNVNEKAYGSKTIAVLVQHIINWRIFVLEKLDGNLTYNIVIDGENDWDTVHITKKEEWDFLKQKLQNTQDDLLQKLSSGTDDLLRKKVPGKKYTFGPILTSIAQHDIYHSGQIAMLNEIQKS